MVLQNHMCILFLVLKFSKKKTSKLFFDVHRFTKATNVLILYRSSFINTIIYTKIFDFPFSDISETLGAHILEMPFKGDNISMYILLPPFSNTENSIEATLKNLTLENFKKVVDSGELIARTVQVAFPKFTLETTIEMTAVSILYIFVNLNV